jgi:serine/threonine-protein kinase
MKICHTCRQIYADDLEFCPRDGAHLATQGAETETQLAAGLSRRFHLVRRLGAGGMGTVFLAEQMGLGNRLVALKVLNRKLLDDREFLARFQDEAASTGSIHHVNVVTIYESGQADDGTPYIAMEYLEGETLREVLKRRGALPVTEVAEILRQAARGLNAAHKLGIIHRDLKPDNIFLTWGDEGDPVVKVLDFGIAKLLESTTQTITGMVLGTPAYMSYEQAFGVKSDELDARSDVYSLGIVVYEMLTGRLPFQSDTPAGFFHMHLMEDPPPFQAVVEGLDVPPAVEQAVMKALTKDCRQRYGSVLDFARDLAIGAHLSPQAETPVPNPSPAIVAPLAGPRAVQESSAPLSQSAISADAGIAVQTPPPTPREIIDVSPRTPPRESEPQAPLILPPGALDLPHFPFSEGILSLMRYVVLGAVLLAVGAGVVWYFSHRAEKNLSTQAPAGKNLNPQRPAGVQASLPASITGNMSWAAQAGESKGEVKVNPRDGLQYVWIPPGSSMMGCSPGDTDCDSDEKPAHRVTFTRGFWLGRTEVTVGAFKRFSAAAGNPLPSPPKYNPGWKDEQMPMVSVSWLDAWAYCAWAGGWLPAEANWEYAARGGSTEARYGVLGQIAWYNANSGGHPHPVGQKLANGFGLYDMLGNVEEWVNDLYDEGRYDSNPPQDPTVPATGGFRVLRGGSWKSIPLGVRASSRNTNDPEGRDENQGFRCSAGATGH